MLFLVKGMANGERRMPDLNGASYQRWVPKGEALQWQRASDDSFGREEVRLRRYAAPLQNSRASEEKSDGFRRQCCGSDFRWQSSDQHLIWEWGTEDWTEDSRLKSKGSLDWRVKGLNTNAILGRLPRIHAMRGNKSRILLMRDQKPRIRRMRFIFLFSWNYWPRICEMRGTWTRISQMRRSQVWNQLHKLPPL